MIDLYSIENELRQENKDIVFCGVDEAGRGPLAGPVFAAAVILPINCIISGLNDSKKLSEKKREQLFDEIINKAVSYSISSVGEKEIDSINILNATFKAMANAVKGLSITPNLALIDGNRIKGLSVPAKCIVKGDAKCASIAAASILAKVSRDRFMVNLSKDYPLYFFEKHKGYGTKLHYEAILKYGVLDFHRKTFLKGIVV